MNSYPYTLINYNETFHVKEKKRAEAKKIEEEVAAFVKSGGIIKHIPPGCVADDSHPTMIELRRSPPISIGSAEHNFSVVEQRSKRRARRHGRPA